MIIPNIWKIINGPNHQPVNLCRLLFRMYPCQWILQTTTRWIEMEHTSGLWLDLDYYSRWLGNWVAPFLPIQWGMYGDYEYPKRPLAPSIHQLINDDIPFELSNHLTPHVQWLCNSHHQRVSKGYPGWILRSVRSIHGVTCTYGRRSETSRSSRAACLGMERLRPLQSPKTIVEVPSKVMNSRRHVLYVYGISIHLSIHLSIYLPTYLSIYLPIYLYVFAIGWFLGKCW